LFITIAVSHRLFDIVSTFGSRACCSEVCGQSTSTLILLGLYVICVLYCRISQSETLHISRR